MADYVFTQNGDNNVQIGTDRLTGDFKGASMFATVEQARQYNRLRQYEDTGLTPDEIAALRDELAAMWAENDMLKDTMIRACVWLDVHGRPGIPDVTRTLSEAVAATVKKEAHNEP